jgi:serine/threonine protein kinase/tetratricopeptide (TPR) repeat protein
MIGTRVGPYELIEEIGTGGMALVYRAYQPSMDRPVAIKIINQLLADDTAGLERFQREARLVAKLEHAHILPIYDYNSSHMPPYIVMRYLPGGTLKELLAKGPLAADTAIHILKQIAAAIDYAHRHGIVHRDLKPSNIILDSSGDAYLADFGIARVTSVESKLTQAGAAMGTPTYMSPEQIEGLAAGPRADLYALGVILFEMLTGTAPFNGPHTPAVVVQHLNDPAPNASERVKNLGTAIDLVIARAMAKQPADRFASAVDLITAAAHALNISPPSTPPSPAARYGPTPRRGPGSLTLQRRTPVEQNKQVSILHASAAEFEQSLFDSLDAETVQERLATLWEGIDRTLRDSSGTVVERPQNAVTVVWGADAAREDDPERSIRAALALRDANIDLATDAGQPLQIGVTTGPALLTPHPAIPNGIAASGPTLALAHRLPSAIPEGGIVITLDLYRLVRGVFDVDPLPPLRGRGNKEAIEVYYVPQAKPRAFRIIARGVEGIDTHLIGRDIELKQLQEALEAALDTEDGEAQLVTIVGEAGLGKTRLLTELEAWYELHPATFWNFKGRATPEMINRPYALLRDVFMFRFKIQDSDRPGVVQTKMEEGVQWFMGPGHETDAHLIGHLLGLDLPASPALQDILKDTARLQDLALGALVAFFRAVAHAETQCVAMIMLEDMHWADDKSLDTLNYLVRESRAEHLVVVCLTRPELLERRPGWGSGEPFHKRIDLRALSKRESRKLVKEILQKVNDLPDSLRDLIVERSEGNPLYMEELIKMLIEDRTVIKGDAGWTVETNRLSDLRIPDTLKGILQVRLDSLTPDERTALQRAAVVGRIFWDTAVAALQTADNIPIPVAETLALLKERELIYSRETSTFANAHEYMFGSNLLRDAAYDSALKRQQRAYHAATADWLIARDGERLTIAEHLAEAGEQERAADYLQRAGEQALLVGATADARTLFEKALTLTTQILPSRIALTRQLGMVQWQLGNYPQARQYLDESLKLAKAKNDRAAMAEALGRLGRIAEDSGDFAAAQKYVAESLSLARETGDKPALAYAYRNLGNLVASFARYAEAEAAYRESLTLTRELNDASGTAASLGNLGRVLYRLPEPR